MTNRRAGTYPNTCVPYERKLLEGHAVWLATATGQSIRKAAAELGMSPSTAWRRWWFYIDFTLPERYGVKRGRIPPQRGTRACPRGRPYQDVLDGPGGPLYQGPR